VPDVHFWHKADIASLRIINPSSLADGKLTELFIQNAKPRDSAYQVWDTRQHNLCLRIQPGGAKSWVVVYSRHGRSRWLTLGNAKAINLSDARMLAAKAMLAAAEGKDPAAEKKAERGAGTFAELAAKYVERYSRRHNKSWRASDTLIQRYALPRWGKLQASAVTRGDVRAMMGRMASTPVVANGVKAAVSAIYNWAISQEIVVANPCKLVPNNPVKSRERVLCDSELPKFWSAFGNLDPVRGAALKMILLTGQRPGEVANMRREHIIDGWWQMPGEPIPGVWPGTKNAASHRVWLPQPAQDLLAAMFDGNGSGFVFASPRGGPISKLDDAMRSIAATLKIEPSVRPHDLRRSHGSTITALGFGRDAMNRIQNHKEGGIADVYDRHRYEAESKQIMESVANKIMALVEGREADNVRRPSFARPTTGS
jgi:integrase